MERTIPDVSHPLSIIHYVPMQESSTSIDTALPKPNSTSASVPHSHGQHYYE